MNSLKTELLKKSEKLKEEAHQRVMDKIAEVDALISLQSQPIIEK